MSGDHGTGSHGDMHGDDAEAGTLFQSVRSEGIGAGIDIAFAERTFRRKVPAWVPARRWIATLRQSRFSKAASIACKFRATRPAKRVDGDAETGDHEKPGKPDRVAGRERVWLEYCERRGLRVNEACGVHANGKFREAFFGEVAFIGPRVAAQGGFFAEEALALPFVAEADAVAVFHRGILIMEAFFEFGREDDA